MKEGGLEELSLGLGKLRSLEEVTLELPRSILPENMGRLSSLRYLGITANTAFEETKETKKTLLESMGELLSPQELELDSANLDCLPHGLSSLTKLTLGRGFGFLQEDCESLTSLRHLNLLHCRLGRLQTLPSLETLRLCNSSLDFIRLPALRKLTFQHYKDWKSFRMHLPALQSLTFDHCKGMESLPEDVESLPSLRELRLWSCNDLKILSANLGNAIAGRPRSAKADAMNGQQLKLDIYDCPLVEDFQLPELGWVLSSGEDGHRIYVKDIEKSEIREKKWSMARGMGDSR